MSTKLSQICSLLNAKLQGADVAFDKVSIDSRKVKPGELFVAIHGENFDGHTFIEQIKAQGAIAVVTDHSVAVDIPQLIVADTRIALGQLAALHRQKFNLPIIALTGSCGKTTTKEMIRSILAQCGPVLATEGTLNNDIGVPLTLLELTEQHRYAVVEMGANHPGEIAYLTQLVQPQVAFINNVAPAHLEGFGSIEGIAKAKAEIFQSLATEGIALINADDHFSDWLQAVLSKKTTLLFGVKSDKAQIAARNIQVNELGCYQFILQMPQGEVSIQLSVFGEHNVLNALAAAAATHAVGVDLAAIKQGLETAAAVKGRLVIRQGLAGARIFDDTYNANPFSMAAALRVLAGHPGERIFIMGDMGELGPDAEEHHRAVGQLAKELGVHKLYAYGALSSAAVKAFGAGAMHFANQSELSATVRNMLQPQMTVLVKGSRSAKMENVVCALLAEDSMK